mmetsp:Transcript_3685/g.3821  ORF Transcript_3685/g.3821 Transcript_3685/m.3821 type:complete len:1269 (+) Transcript_3685:182-3988(+)|eukprot:CAMPEP_0182432264 /NCGR_PEP_ID=MMETSP1167-20130531/55169_1 /TAXON_ID=2988 /ORGANISM="Mallomonas Sp, Strain CCMP3275" /LENGTH=1268 /DNA_ID=CAMNT_0024619549 /DNA_START=167 /DNA_END=3973 /DNA_ORIENTATION=+
MLNKRFFFGRNSSATVDEVSNTSSNISISNDDTHSVHSAESSYSSDVSWMTSDKNIFMSGIRRLGGSQESATLDEAMRNLYQDADILEEKCKQSVMGNEGTKRTCDLSMSSLRKHQAEEEARGSALKTHKKPQEVIDRLPDGFFTKDYDPVEKQLMEVSTWRDLDLTERFMVLIEEADTDKDMVLSRLAAMIEASHSDLITCMRDVHAIDLDLARTGVQMMNSRRKLQSAEELLVNGSMKITRMYQFRHRLESVRVLLQSMKEVRDLFQWMRESIRTGDTQRAAECASTLLQLLQTESFEQLEGVQSYGAGVQEMVPLIRRRADAALYQLCSRRFVSEEYDSVLHSYLLLDTMRDSMGVQIIDRFSNKRASTGAEETVLYDSYGCMEGLCPRIHRFLLTEVEATVRLVLIEHIHTQTVQIRKQVASGSANAGGVYSDLADCSLSTLYDRVTPEMMVCSVVRTCELLVDVVHTMFQIVQWHRSPFDNRNTDIYFLHRGPSDQFPANDEKGMWSMSQSQKLDDDSVFAMSNTRDTSITAASNDSKALFSSKSSDLDREISSSDASTGISKLILQRQAQFDSVYNELLDGRRSLFETIQTAIMELLESLTPSASVSVEDFLCMIWALQKVVSVGKEFCGAESRDLLAAVRQKSVEYISELHKEYFNRLRQMVEAETWRSVPVRLGEMGGIRELLRTNLKKETRTLGKDVMRLRGMVREMETAERSYTAQKTSRYPGSTKAHVRNNTSRDRLLDGTPRSNHMRSGSGGPDAKPQQGGDGEAIPSTDNIDTDTVLVSFALVGNPIQAVSQEELDGSEKDEEWVGNTDMLSFLFDDDPSSLPSGRRSAAMIVTQSALNGLTKYTVKYLQLMHVMRSVSVDVLQGLCQLFDFYLCAVFNCFVPNEQRQRILSKLVARMAAPAPCQGKDFEALQQCMQRALAGIPAGAILSSGEQQDVDGGSEFASSAVASLSSQLQQTGMLFAKLLPRAPAAVEAPEEDTLFALNEHIVAAESCWFAAKLLDELKPKLLRLLGTEDDGASCETYVSEFSLVAGQLRALVYKCMCPRLIGTNWSSTIADNSGWEMRKMREDPHEWVDGIVGKCKDVWQYMGRGEEFAEASSLVREQVWLELCQVAFDTVLDGFSRVRKVSTEGRACMAMDISALQSGLDAIHPCRPPRGKLHVDNYVRASYLSEDEVLEWVRNNWQAYAYRHLHGLLQQASSSANSNMNVNVLKKKRLTTALTVLDSLHDEVAGEEATSRETSSDLSSKLFGKRFG